ncbi:MAG: hypothetical protein V7K38_21220 [Nostoc sp.]|uniref:hypothetical protein n=1 Tax=Nostoc sp. TaxID=1180 RepID=UPI002FF9B1A3
MPVINLADIQQITKTQQQVLFPIQKYYPNHSAFNPIVADNFSLVMRQLFLGLTVEPLLNAYPQVETRRFCSDISLLVANFQIKCLETARLGKRELASVKVFSSVLISVSVSPDRVCAVS